MAIDLQLQALPLDCFLLEHIHEGEAALEDVFLLHRFVSTEERVLTRQAMDHLATWFQNPASYTYILNHPDVALRHLFFGRRWGVMQYLLESACEPSEHEWIGAALMRDLKWCIDPGQGGYAFRLPPEWVARVALELASLDTNRLVVAWDPEAMEALHVYKGSYPPGAEFPPYILEEFSSLRDFYHQAASYRDAVVGRFF